MVNTGYALQEMQRYRNQSEGNAESYQWYRRGREGEVKRGEDVDGLSVGAWLSLR